MHNHSRLEKINFYKIHRWKPNWQLLSIHRKTRDSNMIWTNVNEAFTDSAFNTGGYMRRIRRTKYMTQMHRSPLFSRFCWKSGSEWLIPGVSDEVRGDVVVLGVPKNALQLSFGLLSDGFTNIFVGNSPIEPHIQVDEGNIRGGNSVGHASNFPIQPWQQFSNGLHQKNNEVGQLWRSHTHIQDIQLQLLALTEKKEKKLEQFLTLVALVELGITSKPVETPPLQSVSDGASIDFLVAANNQISHNQ